MVLKVLGSSSHGNSYILENDREALLLEAGVRFASVKQALDYNITKVVGCLITHEHKDHAGYINEVLKATVPVYASAGTIENTPIEGPRRANVCKAGTLFTLAVSELFLSGLSTIPPSLWGSSSITKKRVISYSLPIPITCLASLQDLITY